MKQIMDPFQSLFNPPAFIPPEDLSFADCELYPSEIDPYTRNRTSHLQEQLSWIEDSAKGYYFASPYTSSANDNPSEPFSAYNAGCFSNLGMTLRPPGGSSIAYSRSDRFPSPWTGHPSSPSGMESPRSSSWGVGCYMSPPYTNDDAMIPSAEDCRYPSPGALASVALPEVQIQPDHESVVKFEPEFPMGNGSFPSTGVDDTEHKGLGLSSSHPDSCVLGEIPAVHETLIQSPKSPPSRPTSKTSKSSTSKSSTGVDKRRSTRHRGTNTSVSRTLGPTSSPINKTRKTSIARERHFTCSFARYGCVSTFGSKNEWKRHVASKHLQLGVYRCDIKDCNISMGSGIDHRHHHHKKSRSSSSRIGCGDDGHNQNGLRNIFNRKDLFTQHLRRMHAPRSRGNRVEPSTKEHEAFEDSLDGVRERCWHPQRQAPQATQCGFCRKEFQGEHSWDERMEHMGRHFERDNAQPEDEAEDITLREWAISEGIVQWSDGRWVLTSICEA